MRWNETTHIFEQSLNDGASWAVLPLNASILNEGSINAARLPANIAVKDANNAFSAIQSFQAGAGIAGSFSVNGNSGFTGTINVTGGFTSGANSSLQAAGNISLNIRNTQAGAANTSELSLGIDNLGRALILQSFASNYASSGFFAAGSSVILTQGAGGLTVGTLDGTLLRFATNTVERGRFLGTGELVINLAANYNNSQMSIGFDSGIHFPGLNILNTNANNSSFLVLFSNSANGTMGAIQQASGTSVLYSTTSDERLKINFGRFEDLTPLRSITVHDFKWRSDNIRDHGVFAQEAYEYFPKAISKGTDEINEHGQLIRPWMIDYSKFVPDLIAGWQNHDNQLVEVGNALRALTELYEELKNGGNSN